MFESFNVFISVILPILASIAITVLLCLKVLPSKLDGTFSNKLLQKVHDFFNFKKLYLESILKILFTFLTIACIVAGLFYATVGNVFELFSNIFDAIRYDYGVSEWIWASFFRNFFTGIIIAGVGPVVLRLVYEGALMFVLLVKNVIEINGKLKAPKNDNTDKE